MSDHGWGGWPDDADPESSGYGSEDAGFGSEPSTPDFGAESPAPDFGEAETADLGGFDDAGPDESLDSLVDSPAPAPDAPLDPAGDSTVDGPPFDGPSDGPPGLDDGDPGDGADGGGPELTPVGADPDLDAHADTWTDQAFPEPLDLDTPEPVDGFPWTDPTTLGAAPLPDPDAAYQGGPEAGELADYAGEEIPPGADPWTALSASDDPATSSLARWWSPGTP